MECVSFVYVVLREFALDWISVEASSTFLLCDEAWTGGENRVCHRCSKSRQKEKKVPLWGDRVYYLANFMLSIKC